MAPLTKGAMLLKFLADEGHRVFTVDQARAWGLSLGLRPSYVPDLLAELTKGDWLLRLRRGLYALGGSFTENAPIHEFEIAMALAQPAAISHWSAMNYHGLSDQMPRIVHILTTTSQTLPRPQKSANLGVDIGGFCYHFCRVCEERFFGIAEVWAGSTRIKMTDPERTLIDGITNPELCGGFAEVLHAFDIYSDRLEVDKIVGYALDMNPSTAKRLGWILEHFSIQHKQLDVLRQVPISGYRKLDPSSPAQGPYNSKWKVQENLDQGAQNA